MWTSHLIVHATLEPLGRDESANWSLYPQPLGGDKSSDWWLHPQSPWQRRVIWLVTPPPTPCQRQVSWLVTPPQDPWQRQFIWWWLQPQSPWQRQVSWLLTPPPVTLAETHRCYIQCTVGGGWVVKNLHWKSDLTTSNYKTGVISATGVVAPSKRSQNLQIYNHFDILKS